VENTQDPPELSFEAALTQLEALIDTMEQGRVPLAELLAKFEEGNRLLKLCSGRLKNAELKIEQLKQAAADDEAPTFKSFALSQENGAATQN